MDKAEANIRFETADRHFCHGRFEEALGELEAIEAFFPNNHRLLNAQARTLERLRRYEEAIILCDRLLKEFQYDKIRGLRDGIASTLASPGVQSSNVSAPSIAPTKKETPVSKTKTPFQLKPVRLVILLSLCALMYFGYLALWLGISLIVLYFIGKWMIGKALTRLLSTPFKMKGKALENARVEFHGHVWTDKPTYENFTDDDEDTVEANETLRYAWLELTITPQERSEGFTLWEPGELLLVPGGTPFTGLDSLEDAYTVSEVRLVLDGQEANDEAGKYSGPQRVKILVALPEGEDEFTLAYYFEKLDTLRLSE